MVQIAYAMVAEARSDFMPDTSVGEFAEAIIIIKAIAEEHLLGEMPTESKLARSTNIPRQTVRRKLAALVERGALVRNGHRYALRPEFYNTPRAIAGFYRRLHTLRAITDTILESIDWKVLPENEHRVA
jgi:DNA-binding IclR family transcriptional regulator